MPGVPRSITTNLGPLDGILPSVSGAALSAQGIANWTAAQFDGTTKKVISGGANKGSVRRVKVVCITPGVFLTWKTVIQGTAAPTVTAAGIGGVDEGTVIPAGAIEEFSILDNVDLYMRGSAAAIIQITVWEQ